MKTTTITAAAIVTALFIISSVVQTAQAQIPEFEDRCINVDGFTKAQCDLIWHCAVIEHNPIKECEDKANALVVTQQQAQATSALEKQACKLLKEAIDYSNLELKNAKANGTEVPQSYLDKRTNAIEHYNRDCLQ